LNYHACGVTGVMNGRGDNAVATIAAGQALFFGEEKYYFLYPLNFSMLSLSPR
jgi:hypothetical protein